MSEEFSNGDLENSKINNSALNAEAVANNNTNNNSPDVVQDEHTVLQNLEKQNSVISQTQNPSGDEILYFQNKQNSQSLEKKLEVPILVETNDSHKKENTNSSALVSLCADYKSDSDSESVDSESDSSTDSADSTTDSSSEDGYSSNSSCDSESDQKKKKIEEKKFNKESYLSDLPPVEDLKISVPEDECIEVGIITSIIDTWIVVESYKGSAALDLDTVLFLDSGKRALGKIFEILGPVTEPVYTVRFNSQEQIKALNIKKNLKVYYAPKTPHTTFVFMSEVLKNKGSDASWKDNAEAPPEFQDFSDDEQERLHNSKHAQRAGTLDSSSRDQNRSNKRCYSKTNPRSNLFNTSGFRNPNFCPQRRPNFGRSPSSNGTPVPPLPPFQTPLFSYSVPPPPPPPPSSSSSSPSYQSTSSVLISPPGYFPPMYSGPPFPVFGGLPVFNQNQNFQLPFNQQRSHEQLQTWGRPTRPMFRCPFPPPPASEQDNHHP